LLYAHPKIEAETARIRLVAFGASSFDMEIFCYVKTTDTATFIAIREDLLLRILDLIDASGTSLANPSQTVYFTRDPGMNEKATEDATRTVEEWRSKKVFPFPDFLPAEISKLRGTISYPPADSVLAAEQSSAPSLGTNLRPR
jgi:MscS family membrane protein